MQYGDEVIAHFHAPKNMGTLNEDDPNVGTGMIGSPACGDVMRLQIKVNSDGIIEDAKFKAYGCAAAIASCSITTEWLKGKTLEEARQIKNSDIADYLTLPNMKIHCSIIAEEGIKKSIDDYLSKQNKK
jgi:nitrogen fixation protein NifU and related proteins